MKISIIIPVYNEAATISEAMRRVFVVTPQLPECEVIVVDDGSHDATATVLAGLVEQYGFQLVRHARNQGKGAALQTGIAVAKGDAVLFQDADLEYDPAEWGRVVAALEQNVDAVLGSRMMQGVQGGYWHYVVGGKLLNACINILFRSRLTDAYTGVKCIRMPMVRSMGLVSSGFEIEAELVSKLLVRRARIVEVPITYRPRTFAEGKKIRPRDAWKGVRVALAVFLKRM